MSSCGNPSADQDALMPRRFKFSKGKTCIKCKVNPGKIVIRHAVYCKECFTPLVSMKFRRSLEPFIDENPGTSRRRKLKASGSLLLGFSGGLGSSILLDLVHKTYFTNEPSVNGEIRGGTNHPRGASVWTSCTVCYVEVCNAFPEAHDRTNEIKAVLTSYPKFDFVSLRLEDAFDGSWWCSTAIERDRSQLAVELGKDGLFTEALYQASFPDFSPVDALRTYLGSLPTQTAVSSAIRVLIRLLLLYTGQSRRASHLLLGTSLTTLSISLISSISQGGGHSVLEEFQEEWKSGKAEFIRVVRPLRDVSMKECSMFAWWNSIHVVGRAGQTRAAAGIHGLTKDFIIGLEKDYPSTVSTIARTCAKVEPKSASLGLCILCHRSIQEGLDDWKSRISIRSYSDAKLDSDLVHLPTLARSHTSKIVTTPDGGPSISSQLCYSCRTTLTSKSTRSPKPTQWRAVQSGQFSLSAALPLWVNAKFAQVDAQDEQPTVVSRDGEVWVQKLQDEATQRSQIGDYLLETDAVASGGM